MLTHPKEKKHNSAWATLLKTHKKNVRMRWRAKVLSAWFGRVKNALLRFKLTLLQILSGLAFHANGFIYIHDIGNPCTGLFKFTGLADGI